MERISEEYKHFVEKEAKYELFAGRHRLNAIVEKNLKEICADFERTFLRAIERAVLLQSPPVTHMVYSLLVHRMIKGEAPFLVQCFNERQMMAEEFFAMEPLLSSWYETWETLKRLSKKYVGKVPAIYVEQMMIYEAENILKLFCFIGAISLQKMKNSQEMLTLPIGKGFAVSAGFFKAMQKEIFEDTE